LVFKLLQRISCNT